MNNIKRTAFEDKIKEFSPEKYITAEFLKGMEMKDLQHFADALYKKAGGIRGVFSKGDNGTAFAICGEESELSAFFADFKSAFKVKGGGRGTMVQGTAEADEREIGLFFEKVK